MACYILPQSCCCRVRKPDSSRAEQECGFWVGPGRSFRGPGDGQRCPVFPSTNVLAASIPGLLSVKTYQLREGALVQLPLSRPALPELVVVVIQALPVCAELLQALGVEVLDSGGCFLSVPGGRYL